MAQTTRNRRALIDYEALTFDCYGTMIDWETGIWDALQPLIATNSGSAVTRTNALAAFGRLEHAQETQTPEMLYSDVLAHVHRAMAEHFRLDTTEGLDRDFGNSVSQWPAFPDSAEALRYLKTRYKLVILSNVHRDGFAASNGKLGVAFDAVYTAQDIGSYKPNAANFDYLLSHLSDDLGIQKEDVLHTAQSLFHDHVPAKKLGLSSAWIDRQRLSRGGDWGATAEVEERPAVDFVFFSLQEMAEAVQGT